MIYLPQCLRAWGSTDFQTVFQLEVENLDIGALPLMHAMAAGDYPLPATLQVMVLSSGDSYSAINVKAGVFFKSIRAGCSCADDPTPQEAYNEYCEMVFTVDKQTGEAEVVLLEA